jgi:hypothetical protein
VTQSIAACSEAAVSLGLWVSQWIVTGSAAAADGLAGAADDPVVAAEALAGGAADGAVDAVLPLHATKSMTKDPARAPLSSWPGFLLARTSYLLRWWVNATVAQVLSPPTVRRGTMSSAA